MKGRSLAIQAAKSALEAAGFALPEPIYRLRFDATAPPALANAVPPEPGRSAKRPPLAAAEEHNAAPDAHVEQLVEEERAECVSEDLSDAQRPIE